MNKLQSLHPKQDQKQITHEKKLGEKATRSVKRIKTILSTLYQINLAWVLHEEN